MSVCFQAAEEALLDLFLGKEENKSQMGGQFGNNNRITIFRITRKRGKNILKLEECQFYKVENGSGRDMFPDLMSIFIIFCNSSSVINQSSPPSPGSTVVCLVHSLWTPLHHRQSLFFPPSPFCCCMKHD